MSNRDNHADREQAIAHTRGQERQRTTMIFTSVPLLVSSHHSFTHPPTHRSKNLWIDNDCSSTDTLPLPIRIIVKPQAIEFLVHMSLAAAVASVNALSEPQPLRQSSEQLQSQTSTQQNRRKSVRKAANRNSNSPVPTGSAPSPATVTSSTTVGNSRPADLQWKDLQNVEYLTDGGTSWIHTAILNGRPVVVKTLKPECQDVVLAINEIESELGKFVGSFNRWYTCAPRLFLRL